MRRTALLAALLLPALLVLAGACSSDGGDDAVRADGPTATTAAPALAATPGTLLEDEGETVLGQPLAYPDGVPEISSSIIRLEPGQSTGWHRHDAPMYGYVLAGELTVDYGEDGTRTYRPGDALLEAVGTAHDGTATGDEAVVVLVVNLGADGVEDSVEVPAP